MEKFRDRRLSFTLAILARQYRLHSSGSSFMRIAPRVQLLQVEDGPVSRDTNPATNG